MIEKYINIVNYNNNNIIMKLARIFETKRTKLSNLSWLDEGMLPRNLVLSEEDFKTVWNLRPQEYDDVMVWGKLRKKPRWERSYLRTYEYNGISCKAYPLPNILKKYLAWVNSLDKYGGRKFNQVLVRWYQDGLHYISSHSDPGKKLIPDSPIVHISLGSGDRKFRIRKDKKISKDINTQDGTYLVMSGKFRKEFMHEIVKVSGEKGKRVKQRIDITFRQFVE